MSRLSRIFSFGRHSVQQASLLLAGASLLSSVLGLGRNLILYRLVPKDLLDPYFASFKLSDLLLNLLIFGAITSALLPVITELLHKGEEKEVRKLTDQLISWSLLTFGSLGIVLYLAMPILGRLIVPGFAQHPEEMRVFVSLSRIVLLQPIFFSVSYIVGSLLNGYRRFGSYALAPLIYNTAVIVGASLFPQFGVSGISWAVVIGALLHMSVQYRESLRTGYRFRLDLSVSNRMREVMKLMVPRSLAQGFAQLVPTVYVNLASGLAAGSIAIFSGLNDIQTAPTMIVANSLASASFPAMTSLAHEGNLPEMDRLVSKLIRSVLFVLIPVVALGFILRAQFVRLYVGIGHADWGLTDQAILTFAWFLVGIVPTALITLFARLFYAHKDSRTPLLINVAGGSLAIVAAIFLIRFQHGTVVSLAIAESLSALLQCSLYLILLYARGYIRLPLWEIGRQSLHYLVGAFLLLWTTWASLQAVAQLYSRTNHLYTDRILGLLLQTAIAACVGLLVYFGYSTYGSKEELTWLKKRAFTSGK